MGSVTTNPFVKAGVAIGGSLLGGYLGKKSTANAMQRSPEELAALSGATGAAGDLSAQGRGLTRMGLPAVQGATNYWQTLLSGNRAAMSQATAGPRGAITDQYRGAERSLERSGVRGGVGELARAELSRDRAGKVAGLTTGVQPAAAEQLGGLGTTLTGQGTAALYGVGNVYANLLKAGADNRMYARGEGEKTGNSVGSLIADILGGTAGSAAAGKLAGSDQGGGFWHKLLGLFKRGGGGNPGGQGNPTAIRAYDPITGQYYWDYEPGSGAGFPGGSAGGEWRDRPPQDGHS